MNKFYYNHHSKKKKKLIKIKRAQNIFNKEGCEVHKLRHKNFLLLARE